MKKLIWAGLILLVLAVLFGEWILVELIVSKIKDWWGFYEHTSGDS